LSKGGLWLIGGANGCTGFKKRELEKALKKKKVGTRQRGAKVKGKMSRRGGALKNPCIRQREKRGKK